MVLRRVAAPQLPRHRIPGFRRRRPWTLDPPGIRRGFGVQPSTGEGIDVFRYNPQLVYAGLDLVDLPTLAWCEMEFSVFQSTQKSTVLMGSRFGCDRDRIDSNRLRRLQPLIFRGPKN